MNDAATATTVLAAPGDRLGPFKALVAGPLSSTELAARTGADERHVREWAVGLCAARLTGTRSGRVTRDGRLGRQPSRQVRRAPPEA